MLEGCSVRVKVAGLFLSSSIHGSAARSSNMRVFAFAKPKSAPGKICSPIICLGMLKRA